MCLAVPGKILSIQGDDPLLRTGKVSFGGVVKPVNLAYLPDAKVGDYVVVHVGFALSKLDEQEARQVFDYIREIGELEVQEREQESGKESEEETGRQPRQVLPEEGAA